MMTYFMTAGIVISMVLLWALVQTLWRRVFPEYAQGKDVLEVRGGCGVCMIAGHCVKSEDEPCDSK